MADDPTKRGGPDRRLINVNQPYEVRHWAKKFNVPRRVLREAIDKVGPSVEKVQAELERQSDGAPETDEAS